MGYFKNTLFVGLGRVAVTVLLQLVPATAFCCCASCGASLELGWGNTKPQEDSVPWNGYGRSWASDSVSGMHTTCWHSCCPGNRPTSSGCCIDPCLGEAVPTLNRLSRDSREIRGRSAQPPGALAICLRGRLGQALLGYWGANCATLIHLCDATVHSSLHVHALIRSLGRAVALISY